MGWLRLVGSFKLQISFAEYCLFYRARLQKRPIILRRLLIVATPYAYCDDLIRGASPFTVKPRRCSSPCDYLAWQFSCFYFIFRCSWPCDYLAGQNSNYNVCTHYLYQNTEMTHSTPVTTLLDNIQIIMYVHMTYVKIQKWTRTIGGHWQLEMRVEGALVAKSKGLRVLRDFLRS